jgi:UDP-N-acetylglucosamine--N-acetylmuramyl-(pentapeptide) pyrophosphoryl-undecaprenol N-acetylglucosamine transferase
MKNDEKEMSGQMRFIMAGGGTGGHIFPAIAIANAITEKCPGAEFLFVGAKGKMEMEKVPEAGYRIIGLTIAGYNRSSLLKNITLPFKLVKSFFEVSRIFRDFKPHAVIGVGGYSSFPVLRFAQSKGIPTFIHESNSFAGKSNILLGKNATRIFTATEGMDKFFPAGKITITGNPVRKSIVSPADRNEAMKYFGLNPDKPTVLIIGGSLGARTINQAIDNDLDMLETNGIQVIWQTGKPYHQTAFMRAAGKNNIRVHDFISRMDLAYAAADIAVSRSGAMAVTELCIVGKPVIFVPFPHAAEDHQTFNARRLVEKNAALIVKDEEANEKLVPRIIELLKDETGRKQLSQNISKMANTDADDLVADKIILMLS